MRCVTLSKKVWTTIAMHMSRSRTSMMSHGEWGVLVAEIMGISRSKAYQIVREMNRELKAQGYLTVAGKCPAQYFKQKFYGFQIPGGERNDGK